MVILPFHAAGNAQRMTGRMLSPGLMREDEQLISSVKILMRS
jgi:hypothetical protein